MKKVGLSLLALALSSAAAWALPVSSNITNPARLESAAAPILRVSPASKDAADSVAGNVHANTADITAVRCIDCDPAAGAAFVVYRDAASGTGMGCNYLGTTDNGANWTLTPDLNTTNSVRYPSAMADPVENKPWAIYSANNAKGLYFAIDQAGYNGGLWDPPSAIDTVPLFAPTGHRGSNGIVHCLANRGASYNAAVYYRSGDGGATWGKTVIPFDSISPGYGGTVALWGSDTGDTLMLGSCGRDTSADTSLPSSKMRFWYKMSYDAGLTWTPFTWSCALELLHHQDIAWQQESYQLAIALDKDGYPHFAAYLAFDTTAGGHLGPHCGLWDFHMTASGWDSAMVHPADSLGDNIPQFPNYGMDVYGNLFLSYSNNYAGAVENINIFLAVSRDNGAHWWKMQVTSDGQGYDYPHLPRHIGGFGSQIPVWYQRGSGGFVSWVSTTRPIIGWDSLFGVSGSPTQPRSYNFALNRAYPNPSRVRATISFQLPKAGAYNMKVYNIAGQLVKTMGGRGVAGGNTVPLNTQSMSNGVYFYSLSAGGNVATRKLTVIK